jgi:hypothetical protein
MARAQGGDKAAHAPKHAANHSANGIEAGKADTQFQATAGAGSVVFRVGDRHGDE